MLDCDPTDSGPRVVQTTHKRKLNCLSGNDKLLIVRRFEQGASREQLCREFNVPRSTLCRILHQKERIESQCNEGHGHAVRTRPSKCPELEKCLLEWIRHCEEDEVPVNGPIIKDQALRFAAMLGVTDFKASNGWLEGFKNRFNSKAAMEFPPSANEEPNTGNRILNPANPVHSSDPLGNSVPNDLNLPKGLDHHVLATLKKVVAGIPSEREPKNVKRKWLTLEEKVTLIEDFETNKLSTRKLAEKFGVGKTQVSNLLKDRDSILKDWRENGMGGSTKKRMRKGSADVDAFVYEWFRNAQAQNIQVSGPLIQEKALEVAKALGNPEFKASNGWLCKFKTRHGINWRLSSGEIPDHAGFSGASMECAGTSAEYAGPSVEYDGSSAGPCEGLAEFVRAEELPLQPAVDWRSVLKDWCAGYASCDIYNCIETPLLFGALPDQEMLSSGEKTAKKRLTILLCTNVVGDFEEPMIISSTLPAQLENLRPRELGFSWKVNQYAWMSPEIMNEWLDSFNIRMMVQKRNVVLILEDSKCHPHLELSNVKLVFLPLNARQPLQLGVLKSFKRRYRTKLLRHLLCNKQPRVSKLDAALWIVSAIKDIKAAEVQKCFGEVGLCEAKLDEPTGSKPELENLVRMISSDLPADDYVTSDNHLPTSYSETDIQSIIESIKSSQDDDETDSKEASNTKVDSPPPDHRTALESLEQIEHLLLHDRNTSLYQKLHDVRLEIEKTYTSKCLLQNKNQISNIGHFIAKLNNDEYHYKFVDGVKSE